jgi:hypothetical protein
MGFVMGFRLIRKCRAVVWIRLDAGAPCASHHPKLLFCNDYRLHPVLMA